jgi:phosphomannomutase
MNQIEWKKLQNGSDIRGVAMEGVSGENVNLGPDQAKILGISFARWLKKKHPGAGSIAIGTDSRLSGPALKAAFTEGILLSGMNVLDCGMASTPAMFMTTIDSSVRADAGVMLTASHLPFNRNGMKFFTREGGLDKKDITDILELASEQENSAGDYQSGSPVEGSVTEIDFVSEYCHSVVGFIRQSAGGEKAGGVEKAVDKPLAGLKIIVDAGNGAGGFFAGKVLEPLGAETGGSQFLEPDGKFPNHIPNPEDPNAMKSICDAVIREGADLGIIFDTDVDRAAIVDSGGSPINRNDLIALISAVVLEEHPGSVIVTDSITSVGLKSFIEDELGGIHHRFMRGYKNVINEAIRLNHEGTESWLAIETSGHAALRENYFLDDGAFLVAKLLVKMARLNREGVRLSSLIQNLKRPVEAKEFRLSLKTSDFSEYAMNILESLPAFIDYEEDWILELPNFEGVRVNCLPKKQNGWFLLRMSLHDPVMPLNVESNVQGGVRRMVKRLRSILKRFDDLDISSLYS